MRIGFGLAEGLLLACVAVAATLSIAVPRAGGQAVPALGNGASVATSGAAADPGQIFRAGQNALNQNRLEEAERDFRRVLAIDPQAGVAYANLGVVYMRQKQWGKALDVLRKAQRLSPQLAGIRLNVGLVYSLSKRTDLSLIEMVQRAGGSAQHAQIYNASPSSTRNQVATVAGLRVRF